MNWKISGDNTFPVITAEKHINSGHGNKNAAMLPETCVIFEMGRALPYMKENYETVTLAEKLPCFLENPECIALKGHPSVCFTKGGYGAPASVDTLETLIALGVKKIVIIGLCGGFSRKISVGDVLVPHKTLCEEGTSHHYFEEIEFAFPDRELADSASAYFSQSFRVLTDASVTGDAVYRQTFAKEAYWRERGCAAVDMETSALLAVSKYYGLSAASVLLCSDKHPIDGKSGNWEWGKENFQEIREKYIRMAVQFALSI